MWLSLNGGQWWLPMTTPAPLGAKKLFARVANEDERELLDVGALNHGGDVGGDAAGGDDPESQATASDSAENDQQQLALASTVRTAKAPAKLPKAKKGKRKGKGKDLSRANANANATSQPKGDGDERTIADAGADGEAVDSHVGDGDDGSLAPMEKRKSVHELRSEDAMSRMDAAFKKLAMDRQDFLNAKLHDEVLGSGGGGGGAKKRRRKYDLKRLRGLLAAVDAGAPTYAKGKMCVAVKKKTPFLSARAGEEVDFLETGLNIPAGVWLGRLNVKGVVRFGFVETEDFMISASSVNNVMHGAYSPQVSPVKGVAAAAGRRHGGPPPPRNSVALGSDGGVGNAVGASIDPVGEVRAAVGSAEGALSPPPPPPSTKPKLVDTDAAKDAEQQRVAKAKAAAQQKAKQKAAAAKLAKEEAADAEREKEAAVQASIREARSARVARVVQWFGSVPLHWPWAFLTWAHVLQLPFAVAQECIVSALLAAPKLRAWGVFPIGGSAAFVWAFGHASV
jgi:hypothetical protein